MLGEPVPVDAVDVDAADRERAAGRRDAGELIVLQRFPEVRAGRGNGTGGQLTGRGGGAAAPDRRRA